MHPSFVPVGALHAPPAVTLLEQLDGVPGEELGDLDAGDARLLEQRCHGASHDGARSLDAHHCKMSPGAAARTLRSIAVSSARTPSASTWAMLASTPSEIGAVAKITSPSNGVATGVIRR
jgi:hypothetical protein